MFNRILIPLDGSPLAEQVLPYAKILSRATETSIVLLGVIEFAPAKLMTPGEEELSLPELVEIQRKQIKMYLQELATALGQKGLSANHEILEGHPAYCILDRAAQEPGTLIAMSTHGRSGMGRWALGSVTDKVLHATANPLLIVRSSDEPTPESEIAIKSIIVPLDGSELAEQVLPHVVYLAKSLDLSITLLRVTPSVGEYYRLMDLPMPENDNLPEQMDAEALAYLEDQGKKIRHKGVSRVEERLAHGSPAIAIPDLAKEIPNSLVAMTTHGRSGLGRWVLGSVADRVIRHSGGPVLVIRASE